MVTLAAIGMWMLAGVVIGSFVGFLALCAFALSRELSGWDSE